MGNPASEKMLQAVCAAKESAERAERDYDFGADMLQMKASRSIDLFGGNAVSQVADIASEARKICDALYASYQMLVRMVDEQCRPLLEQGPDCLAVREVRDLIKWLNDESEIENNFTASLNSHSLGGIASGRYIPTIENKMIQSFWETKYSMWPGREEAEQAEQKKRMEAAELRKKEAEQRKLEAEQAQREAEAAYEKEYAEWKKKADVIEQRRKEKLESALAAAKEARLSELETARTKEVESAAAEKTACEQKKAEAEAALASLGLFKFAEKKTAKNTIAEMTAKIAGAAARREAAEQTYEKGIGGLNMWLGKKKETLRKELEKADPLPPEPQKPRRSTAQMLTHDSLKQAILDGMVPGHLYTLTELQETIPELAEVSNQRVSALLRQLVGCGVERVEDRRRAYFQRID